MITIERKEAIKKGFITSIPILLGYIPVAISFGLLSKNAGLSLGQTFLMSFFVYAGASQFMAIELMVQGLSGGSIILATFLLNSRHLMMSAALSLGFKDIERKYLPILAFGITDETFSLTSFNKEKLSLPFTLTIFLVAHLVWWTGSILGYLVGEILPQSLQSSLSIGLYAMFAALLFGQVKGNGKIIVLSLISMLIYFFIYKFSPIGSGWDIVVGIILSSLLGSFIFRKRDEEI